MQCDVSSCVICMSNEPQYLVDYNRYKNEEGAILSCMLKVLSNETMITIANFYLFHKHFKMDICTASELSHYIVVQ